MYCEIETEKNDFFVFLFSNNYELYEVSCLLCIIIDDNHFIFVKKKKKNSKHNLIGKN